jgi:hypothetical protein
MKLVFLQSGDFDPIIDGTVVQKILTFNVDIASCQLFRFLCTRNRKCYETRRDIYTEYESDNLRKYLLSAGYIFLRSRILLEPSILFQLVEKRKRSPLY